MPTSRRIARLERVVLETVATTLQREVHDPRVGMVTVTRVRLAPDLSAATVWWSCLGDEAARRTTERGLAAATRMLQSRVAQAMGTRVTPTLALRFDQGLEKAQRLQGIFDKIREERGEPPAVPDEAPEDGARGDDDDEDDDAEADDREDGEGRGEGATGGPSAEDDDEARPSPADDGGDEADRTPDDDGDDETSRPPEDDGDDRAGRKPRDDATGAGDSAPPPRRAPDR